MFESELIAAKKAAHEAGTAILKIADEYYKTAVLQADRTVVTKADIEADRILQRYLREGFPEYGWLSEETRDDASRCDKEYVWIVDPMDGTREFVMKLPEYVVSVALAEKGQIILGVIYHPVTGDLYESVKGQGTKCNSTFVNCEHKISSKPRVEVSRSDIEKNIFTNYESYTELFPVGSIAYKLARLSAGLSDATLSLTPKNEWDIAAGVILVTEAGGQVTDLSGYTHQFNQANTLVDGIIAATPDAYDIIRKI